MKKLIFTAIITLSTVFAGAEDLTFMLGHSDYEVVQDFGPQSIGDKRFLSKGVIIVTGQETVLRCPEDGIILMVEKNGTFPPAYFVNHNYPINSDDYSVPLIVIQFNDRRGIVLFNIDAFLWEPGSLITRGELLGEVLKDSAGENIVFQMNVFETEAPFGELKFGSLMWPVMDEEDKSQNNYEVILIDPKSQFSY